ncbi:hypothetical protein [Microbacterium sp. SSM24]|uniref:hypothetical protein n=1 Tax=Microbacterium sp. SSM24 TaxID=2991714 RepID=UPI002226ECBE|nr:hypothetical protein [Microbacterium sp. SSM24]MCW3494150.1 hypothetical protein [Microbacterium sp. SSM24]
MTNSSSDPQNGSPQQLRDLARTGDEHDRWLLAGRDDVDSDLFILLAEIGEEDVLVMLARNTATPGPVLELLSERGGVLADEARLNTNAPADLKDDSPIGSHSAHSIGLYLDERQATPSQRRALNREYERSAHPGGRRLGEVWEQVRSRV